jgi:hypothetical protein
VVEGGGFEPPKAEPSDLQSGPFGHSGTPPRGGHINMELLCLKQPLNNATTVVNIKLNRRLAMSYSHMGTPTLPSALLRFTSEFGMGSGGATVLLSLDKNFCLN